MPLGYKYVERDATDFVNWAEIGKNMSDMLQNENKIREEKKAAIDEDSRQLGVTLSKYPQGQDANARTAALKLADDATQYKNLQLKMLKSGKLKLRDYLINTQNLKDDITRSFDALESYQKGYGETMDRYRKNESSIIEVNKWAKLDEIGGDWGGVQFVINPANGVLNLAKTKKKIIDGKEVTSISDDPNEIFSMNQIMGITKTKVDRLDAQKISDDWASKMAAYIKTDEARTYVSNLQRQGQVVTVDNVANRKDYITLSSGAQKEVFDFYNAENQWIDSSLSNPYARGSVLMDHLQFVPGTDKMYRITHNKADADANEEAIYEEINPSTQQGTLIFSDKQKKDANDFMRNMTRPKYKYEEKVETKSQIQLQEGRGPTQIGKDIQDENDYASNLAKNIVDLAAGSDKDAANAKGYFDANGVKIKKAGQSISVMKKDKDGNELGWVDFDINMPIPKLLKSIVGAVNFKNGNEVKIVKYGTGYSKGKNPNLKTTFETPAAPKKINYTKIFDEQVLAIPSDPFGYKQEKAISLLKPYMDKLNITMQPSGTAGNYITFRSPGKPDLEVGTNAYTSSGEVEFRTKLTDWINQNFKDEQSKKDALKLEEGELD